jgi:hypothetical protein
MGDPRGIEDEIVDYYRSVPVTESRRVAALMAATIQVQRETELARAESRRRAALVALGGLCALALVAFLVAMNLTSETPSGAGVYTAAPAVSGSPSPSVSPSPSPSPSWTLETP